MAIHLPDPKLSAGSSLTGETKPSALLRLGTSLFRLLIPFRIRLLLITKMTPRKFETIMQTQLEHPEKS